MARHRMPVLLFARTLRPREKRELHFRYRIGSVSRSVTALVGRIELYNRPGLFFYYKIAVHTGPQ